MTSTELERLIRERLEAANLGSAINDRKSQFLEFPDGLFAELVLHDGSKLVDVERVARELRESLRKQGIELDVVVRSIWVIQSVDGASHRARGVSGGIRYAMAFPATLVSGTMTAMVEVDVTDLAINAMKRKLGMDEKTAMKEVVELVKEFLKLRLSYGGESYWDPLRDPQLDLNETTLSHLLAARTAVGKS